MSSSGGAGPAVSGAPSGRPAVVGSEKEKVHKNNFLSEEEGLVTEIMDYLLGISVG